jgi:hypothetical protein
MSRLLECFFFFVHIKILLRCCIFSNRLVLVFILICFLCSYFSSTSSIYINIFLILSSLRANPLNILVILIPFVLYFCQKYRKFFCSMICCVTIHAYCWWMWKIPCIISNLMEIVAGYWSCKFFQIIITPCRQILKIFKKMGILINHLFGTTGTQIYIIW